MSELQYKSASNVKYLTMEAAFRGSLMPTLLDKGYIINNTKPVNKNRHLLIETMDGTKFCFIYKRQFFLKFGDFYPKLGGMGESINNDRLIWCIDKNVKSILIAYPNGSIYSYTPIEWQEYAINNNTFRLVEVNDYDKINGKYIKRKEITASIKITDLNRFDTKYVKKSIVGE